MQNSRVLKSYGLLYPLLLLIVILFYLDSSAVAEEGKPKAAIGNETCLECHDAILEWKTKRKDIKQPHRLHLESKRMEYDGRQKMCVTCHEAMVTTEPGEGILDGDVYHPDIVMKHDGVWKKYIVRKEITSGSSYLDAVHPEKPYTFKPLLERLVCVDCHGLDSKVKVLYGLDTRTSGK